MAMMTRINTGTTVHSISITVLWEVREGTDSLVIKAHDHVNEQPEDKGCDQRDDDQQCVVKCRQAFVDHRGRRLHAKLATAWVPPPQQRRQH